MFKLTIQDLTSKVTFDLHFLTHDVMMEEVGELNGGLDYQIVAMGFDASVKMPEFA
jgi:hypothetical protein